MLRDKKYLDEIVAYFMTKVDKNGVLELTVDIESSHNDMKVYSTGKQYVGYQQIVRERNIIMIQMGHVECKRASNVFTLEWDWYPKGHEKEARRDENLLEEFLYILSHFEDLIIHSKNGERFDIPYINGRLFLLQLGSLPMFDHKDVEKVVRRNMYLNSYALDYLAKMLGSGGKVKMDRDVWINIEEYNSIKDMNQMRRYGKKDILDTNLTIHKVAPYVPELRAFTLIKFSGSTCHHCAARKMVGKLEKRGFKRTLTGKRQIWHCTNKRHPKTKPSWFVENRIQRYD